MRMGGCGFVSSREGDTFLLEGAIEEGRDNEEYPDRKEVRKGE